MSNHEPNPTRSVVRLRDVVEDDLPTLYQYQLDPDANRMAAVYPREAEAFHAQWAKILCDPNVVARAILADDALAGTISCFKMDEKDGVGYWIAKEHWGRGIATQALKLLLEEVATRPLWARVARHNVGSIRVLERCGFKRTAYELSAETERYVACEEAIMLLT